MAWNGWMAGKTWIRDDRFTLADVLLFGFASFGKDISHPLNSDHKNLTAWFKRTKARPSAEA